MLTPLRPGWFFPSDFCPECVGLPPVRFGELFGVCCKPFCLPGQRTSPPLLFGLFEDSRAFGSGENPFGEIVNCRVEHTRFGHEEDGVIYEPSLLLQDLPSRGVQKSRWFLWIAAEKRCHRFGEKRGIEFSLTVPIAHPNKRKRNCSPMHFRKSLQLAPCLAVGVNRF